MNGITLFTAVSAYYADLHASLQTARTSIHMSYFAFDDGLWARRIGQTLAELAVAGVSVNLMIDEAGLYLDNVYNAFRNRQLLAQLGSSGVKVHLFRTDHKGLSQLNRLHCKFCMIDGHVAYIGGSNIGDHYLDWRDSNIRIEGDLGSGFVALYDHLGQFGSGAPVTSFSYTDLVVGNWPLVLTIPGHRQDIRRALLNLILTAKSAVTLRTWYFLPDREIMDALIAQAESGVQVTILVSHRTRVPWVDLANRWLLQRLRRSGIRIFQYRGRYMHAKEAWNDQGEILFGSANHDTWSLRKSFECCLYIVNPEIVHHLESALQEDLVYCSGAGQNASSLARTFKFPHKDISTPWWNYYHRCMVACSVALLYLGILIYAVAVCTWRGSVDVLNYLWYKWVEVWPSLCRDRSSSVHMHLPDWQIQSEVRAHGSQDVRQTGGSAAP